MAQATNDEKKRDAAKIALSLFRDALEQDLYPQENVEGVFGVRKDKGQSFPVESPFGQGSQPMLLGNIVFNAWKTIWLNQQFNEKEILCAISQNRLPQWFETTIRNNGTPLSYYSKALIDSKLFNKIDWETRVLSKLTHDGQSTVKQAKMAKIFFLIIIFTITMYCIFNF